MNDDEINVLDENTEILTEHDLDEKDDTNEKILDELRNINEQLEILNSTSEVMEDVTEEVTEEVIEEIYVDPSSLPVTTGEYQKGVNDINENLVQIAESLERSNELLEISFIEEETEDNTEEVTEHELIYSNGTVADGSLYFADKVENANINDVYSMLWSCRNLLFIFFFVFLFIICYKALKHAIYRLTN